MAAVVSDRGVALAVAKVLNERAASYGTDAVALETLGTGAGISTADALAYGRAYRIVRDELRKVAAKVAGGELEE